MRIWQMECEEKI